MATATVGAGELKARLGRYLQIVREGGTVVITDRGKTIGRLVPFGSAKAIEERTRELVKAGKVEWGGGTLNDREPPATLIGTETVSDLLVHMREPEL